MKIFKFSLKGSIFLDTLVEIGAKRDLGTKWECVMQKHRKKRLTEQSLERTALF